MMILKDGELEDVFMENSPVLHVSH